MAYFYEGLSGAGRRGTDSGADPVRDFLFSPDGRDFAEAFLMLPRVQAIRIYDLVRALGEELPRGPDA